MGIKYFRDKCGKKMLLQASDVSPKDRIHYMLEIVEADFSFSKWMTTDAKIYIDGKEAICEAQKDG